MKGKEVLFCLAALLSVLLPLCLPQALIGGLADEAVILIALAVLLLCGAATTGFQGRLFLRIFDRRLRNRTRLQYLMACYLYTIISFAGLYFLLIFVCDYRDAAGDYRWYRGAVLHASPDELRHIIIEDLRAPGEKAFRGMDSELWNGIESWDLPAHRAWLRGGRSAGPVPLARILTAARSDAEQTVLYRGDQTWRVYGDCLYLSAITVATVGYGDISPVNFPAKFLVALEVLMGQLIVFIGLGAVFSNLLSGANRPT